MNLGHLLLFYLVKTMLASSVSSEVSLETLTNSDIYDASVIPQYRNEAGRRIPLNITVAMKIVGARWSFEDKIFSIAGDLEMRVKWTDIRLRYNASNGQDYISVHRGGAIWTPDLVFLSPEGASIFRRFNSYRIYPNSSIVGEHESSFRLQWSSSVYSFIFAFQLLLFNSPHEPGQPNLEWDEVNPLVIAEGLQDDSVEIQSFRSDTCDIGQLTRWKSGAFSCLKIQVERKEGETSTNIVRFLLVYVPGAFAVILSCVCLWTDISFVLGRGLVLVACLIQLFIQRSSMNNGLLFLKNTEKLILWLDWCTGFVFAIFFEVALVSCLKRSNYDKLESTSGEERFPQQARTVQEEEEEGIVEDSAGETNTLCNHFHFPRIWLNTFPSTADAINAICRLVFPFCFMIFMSVFFSCYE